MRTGSYNGDARPVNKYDEEGSTPESTDDGPISSTVRRLCPRAFLRRPD